MCNDYIVTTVGTNLQGVTVLLVACSLYVQTSVSRDETFNGTLLVCLLIFGSISAYPDS